MNGEDRYDLAQDDRIEKLERTVASLLVILMSTFMFHGHYGRHALARLIKELD